VLVTNRKHQNTVSGRLLPPSSPGHHAQQARQAYLAALLPGCPVLPGSGLPCCLLPGCLAWSAWLPCDDWWLVGLVWLVWLACCLVCWPAGLAGLLPGLLACWSGWPAGLAGPPGPPDGRAHQPTKEEHQ